MKKLFICLICLFALACLVSCGERAENTVTSGEITAGDSLPETSEDEEALSLSPVHGIRYEEISCRVFAAFDTAYWDGKGVWGYGFWDTAEMLEVYLDGYEVTGDEEYLQKAIGFADAFLETYGENWYLNPYNDDLVWGCIALSRLYGFTGEERYLTVAKTNFDTVLSRGYDTALGGGLYWSVDRESKDACVNCPAVIAACLLGEYTGKDIYFDKAIALMEWVLSVFYTSGGGIKSSVTVEGDENSWVGSFNQGTFIGGCLLLYRHTGEEKWLSYGNTAVKYTVAEMTEEGVIANGEAVRYDHNLPGGKGILVRWLYRYAKALDRRELLGFLQHSLDVAYGNRNEEGLIWTDWWEKTLSSWLATEENGYSKFGMSSAVALGFAALPWWDTEV